MTPWLALSLGLWLGQTPDTGNAQGDVAQLRAQVQQLQAELNSVQQQISGVQQQISGVQQQISGMRDNAAELDRMRQERLEQIARAGALLATADQALAVGELAVGSTLQEVDAALVQILQSASQTGGGQTVALVEGARGAVLRALEAAGRRDTAEARWDLWEVTERLRQARRADLDEPSATTITR